MFKPVIGLLMLVALCAAEAPIRFRSAARRPSVARVRFLARQQAAAATLAPAPTGYPAAGVTPQIPFDLPSSTAKPDVTYLPPDNTYGPPPPQPDATYGPPAPHSSYGPPTEAAVTPDAVYGPPDKSYLPPEENDTERDVVVEVDEEEPVAATVDEQQSTGPQPEVRDEPKAEVEEEEGEEIFVAVADDGAVIAVSNTFDAQGSNGEVAVAAQQSAPLVFQRFPEGRRHIPADAPVPVRLIKMRRGVPAKLRQLQRVQPQTQPQGFALPQRYSTW